MNKKNIIDLSVDSKSSGKRIDKFLTDNLEEKSRTSIQKLICKGKVKVNNKIVNKHYRVNCGDNVILEDFFYHNNSFINIKPQKIKLKVVYEDESILVISKKSGIPTHPSPGHNENTLVNALLNYTDRLSLLAGTERAGIVHRLDKDTSGLIIIAKNDNVHRQLSQQFKSREVEKTYIALVLGKFSENKGEINLPIGRSGVNRKKMGISIDSGREALTKFEKIEEFDNLTLVKVNPITGRTHQIRIHFSYIGHPVIGDRQYGNKESDSLACNLGLDRQFLHAKKLIFFHPVLSKKIELEDELPDDLKNILIKLRRV